MSIKPLNSAGDTIIEVLVVLAVLGLAISISYATASRSLLAARGAQENSEATQLVQAQIEYLRNYAKNPPGDAHDIFLKSPPFATDQLFCIDPFNGDVVAPATFHGSSIYDTSIYPVTDSSANLSDNKCFQGNPVNRYYIAIRHDNTPDAFGNPVDNFTVTAVWDDVQGQGKDTVTIVYRVHYIP